ncbi:MAG: N-acetylglucosamine-6-phosphate deacetylase [Clostridiales bacterium]|nr:N-acetylglucosamine-6-phosphate deacetylase [Clostridiales bacterium]
MLLKNCRFFNENFDFTSGDIQINKDTIENIGIIGGDGIDMSEFIIMPGFVDIHTHGAMGCDASDEDENAVLTMSNALVQKGITSFCPTTMTLPFESLKKAFENIENAKAREQGAKIQGINMEGPFISPSKKGAQAVEHILKPDTDFFNRLNEISEIVLSDIAPETEGAESFVKSISKKCTVSIAHTASDYSAATKSFEWGISHATHLFNAMTPLTSREAGCVGAVFDSDTVTAELICDGIHICPPSLRTAFKILGEDRTVVISDSMRAAGMPHGEYLLGGQKVIVSNDARLSDGTLAGSVTNLFDEFKNLLSFGINIKQATKSVTINPAKVIHKDREIGSISIGKKADLVILDKEMGKIKKVIVNGKIVCQKG